MKLTFLDGSYYKGTVNLEMEFQGFGYLGTDKEGKYGLFDR